MIPTPTGSSPASAWPRRPTPGAAPRGSWRTAGRRRAFERPATATAVRPHAARAEQGPRSRPPPPIAGVEVLNVLRPTVGVPWRGPFAALAPLRDPARGSVLADPACRDAR